MEMMERKKGEKIDQVNEDIEYLFKISMSELERWLSTKKSVYGLVSAARDKKIIWWERELSSLSIFLIVVPRSSVIIEETSL